MSTDYSGGGDPARSLALLWGATKPPSRGPKAGLTVERIVRTAIELADAEGLAALSMRRVAERLGVGTMSLYTYVPAKAELLDLMLDRVMAETVPESDPSDATPDPSAWRPRLEAVAHGNRDLYLRHPWVLRVATSRPTLGPGATGKYEHELRAVDGIGLSDVEMDAVVALVGGFVRGAVRGAVDAAEVERESGLTELQWWEACAPLLEQVLDPARFPVATRVGAAAGEQHQSANSADHGFAFGLERVLDGIDVLVRSRTGTAG
jgi:AcrR family transcriptional regulator